MNKIKSCKKNEKGYEINPITGKKRKSCLPHQVRNLNGFNQSVVKIRL